MSRQTASASVAPKDRVSNSHVSRGRRFHRADAARNRAKNSRSGRPRFAAAVLARNREGEGEVREDAAVLGHDHLRRPAPHRVGVDPRDDQRHEDDPAQTLEVAEEPEAERRDAEELAEVLGSARAHEVQKEGGEAEREPDPDEPRGIPQRKHEPDQGKASRDERERHERDVPPGRCIPQPIVECVVEPERRPED